MSDIQGIADGFTPAQQTSAGLCTPWLGPDQLRPTDDCTVCQGIGASVPDDDVLEAQILAASEYLNAVSGFQFPGVCSGYVRPCAPDQDWLGLYGWAPIPFVLPEGVWPFWGAGCGCGYGCNCCGPTAFSLGVIPIVEITEVKLDGEVLVEDVDYTLVDGLLARLNPDEPTTPAYWPSCQNIAAPDTEVGTMSVTFTHGAGPPALGILAARDLACMMVRAECGDEACKPVQNMVRKTAGATTIELISPTGDIETQLPNSVKLFLDAFAPFRKKFRQYPHLRKPSRGTGAIISTPELGYGQRRWGFGMGAGCLGCS